MKKLGKQVYDISDKTEQEVLDLGNQLQGVGGLQQYLENTDSNVNQEMQDIKAKAMADGTFMKAPNGKASNLKEKQWLQVRTKAFKEWFGDWINDAEHASKIVDENGEPFVVYHGTRIKDLSKFSVYHKDQEVGDMYGAYFTKKKKYAQTYGPKVYEVFLNIKSPVFTEGPHTGVIGKRVKDKLDNRGIDGIVNDRYDNDWVSKLFHKTRSEIIVFDPNQIKSATGNNGGFSSRNDDIRFAIGQSYGKSNPYHNARKATKQQREDLLKLVIQNKYVGNGTDLLSLTDNKGTTLFLIDHSSNSLLLENQQENKEKGVETDLFGIRKKYSLSKLTEDDITEITRNISYFYGNSERAVRNRLQELGITSENMSEFDIIAAIQRGIRSNGLLDGSAGGIELQTQQDGSGVDGRENQGVLSEFRTSRGEVYGFLDADGNIGLDYNIITAEHPIHEYTHLWDRVV